MKRALNIALILVLLLTSFRDALFYVAFKIQQDQIAATLCVNLYEPAVMCSGTCYFDYTIQQAKEEERSASSAPEREEITQSYLVPTAPVAAVATVLEMTARPCFAEGWIPTPALNSVFRPPRA
ncbi:MAG: hypothetical protein AAF798_20960 [Bacteroidota bacterium]